MKPSDRVALIKKVCARLAGFDWPDLDLTLRQFGLPWTEQWRGDSYTYAIHHVEDASDATLSALHEHLFDGKEFGGAALDEAPGPWADGRFRLFMSHVNADKVFVAQVKRQLAFRGVDCFVAHEDIDPTKDWVREIEGALATCDALCAFMTPTFHQSSWTDQEIGFCVRRRVLIVPIRMGMDPYGFVARYQALQGTGKSPEDLAMALFDILTGHDLTSATTARAIIRQFEDSTSFADAKRNAALLRSIRQWTPELLRRAEEALEQNGQIESAFGVPKTVRALIAQHSQ